MHVGPREVINLELDFPDTPSPWMLVKHRTGDVRNTGEGNSMLVKNASRHHLYLSSPETSRWLVSSARYQSSHLFRDFPRPSPCPSSLFLIALGTTSSGKDVCLNSPCARSRNSTICCHTPLDFRVDMCSPIKPSKSYNLSRKRPLCTPPGIHRGGQNGFQAGCPRISLERTTTLIPGQYLHLGLLAHNRLCMTPMQTWSIGPPRHDGRQSRVLGIAY